MSQGKSHGIGSGLFGKESNVVYDVYLNLTPLMDVMSNILFFLLAAFGASAVAVLSVTVPVDTPPTVAEDKPDDKVTVTLRADAGGFSLGCQAASKTPDELKDCSRRIPKKADRTYDLVALNGALIEIKTKFAGSDTLMLVPDDDINFEGVVHILDAARTMKQSNFRKLDLYPNTILSHLAE